MKITSTIALCLFTSLLLLGCDQSQDIKNIDCDSPNLTKAEKQQANCFWNMGAPTDRSQNKGF
ncbi:hypothetical protein NDJ06_15600 [Vibrio alginolyticus]|uniref:hypothetical protein n=1 Tax=Vibrio alginolyticus TaxID=663 RepID=UPI001A1DF0B4|nr:hypothetical protein [Vibrio alginolyticus]EGQ7841511.1 hypothetical protein [Vibrio alginolyticus]ELA6608792.1 hypothetical protein [Vibrio alginolyticus]MCS0186720.1 hypothetical protein [Vibrio alginolyticus]